MNRVYLLVYADSLWDRESVKSWADTSPLVETWRYDLPNCFYLVSDATAADLSRDLRERLSSQGRFLITEVAENRQGALPTDSWYFLNRKKTRKPLLTVEQEA